MCQIITENLTKNYKKRPIFTNVNICLDSSKYNFFIGENGTGKSTMIKCLLDEIKYSGKINKHNLTFSYAPEAILLPEYISVYNFLLLIAMVKRKDKQEVIKLIDNYLKLFVIEKYRYHLIHQLSKGTRQKIILIQALLTKADVYIFDEPLSGLDLESRKNFIVEIRKLKRKNKLIIIATHFIDEYKFRYKNIYKFPLS